MKRKSRLIKMNVMVCLLAIVLCYTGFISQAAGIAIDASFDDWNSVPKTTLAHSNIDNAAIVWDGDTVYLYAQEKQNKDCSISWGSQFKFVTSNNEEVNFSVNPTSWNWHEPTKELNVTGVTGAKGQGQFVDTMQSYQWEMSFPASLFKQADSISLVDMSGNVLIKDVTNQSGTASTEEPTTEKATTEEPTTQQPYTEGNIPNGPVIIDGYYDDWSGLDQSNAFTWYSNNTLCSHTGGIFMDDDKVYVHVKLNELYLSQIPLTSFHIKVNGEQTISFAANYKNDDNTINYNGNVYDLPVGITMLGIFDQQGGKQHLGDLAVTIGSKNAVSSGNGTMIKDPVDEFEFSLDIKTLSKLTGIPEESIKSVSFSCDNLGKDSITTSGTSTGTYLGIAVCLLITAAILYVRKRKQVRE